jgi:hypothetical protein
MEVDKKEVRMKQHRLMEYCSLHTGIPLRTKLCREQKFQVESRSICFKCNIMDTMQDIDSSH